MESQFSKATGFGTRRGCVIVLKSRPCSDDASFSRQFFLQLLSGNQLTLEEALSTAASNKSTAEDKFFTTNKRVEKRGRKVVVVVVVAI